MGNPCEWPINVVKDDKPKKLTGLNQKVSGWLYGLHVPDTQTNGHRRIGWHLTHLTVNKRNVVNPSFSRKGK
jgi:hypothetical protein